MGIGRGSAGAIQVSLYFLVFHFEMAHVAT